MHLFDVDSVDLRFYFDEELKKLAAVEIAEEMAFDSLNTPVRSGLYDPRMGPLDQFSKCETCSLPERACPGHMGYIQLEFPVYHPRMMTDLRRILHGSCIFCQKLKLKPGRRFTYLKRFELVRAGLFMHARKLEESPDGFYGEHQAEHANHILSTAEVTARHHKIGDPTLIPDDPFQFTDVQMRAISNTVKNLIIKEAKKNGYDESQLEEFYKSVAADMHAPVHHERLLTIKELYAEISTTCPFCKSLRPSFTSPEKNPNKLFCHLPRSKVPTMDHPNKLALQRLIRPLRGEVPDEELASPYAPVLGKPIYMFPLEIYNYVKQVWSEDQEIFDFIYSLPNKDKMEFSHFFMTVVPVPPNRYRSPMKRAGAFYEHDLNYLFRQVIFLQKGIHRELEASADKAWTDRIFSRVNDIQRAVNDLFDFSEHSQAAHNKVIFGYKQLLEKKEGLMRNNMMGKRVNFTARSVILPDPMIHTNEVSVPYVFAKKLSFPEVANDLNMAKLRQAILNGPDKYPGANGVKIGGRVYNFRGLPFFKRKAFSQILQKGSTVVYRHVVDGDMLLVNRQPSLHRVSMMAHKARVLCNQKTIRIHYANCKSYNADFDGDEMNLHIPQDLVAQSEARELIRNSNQYCSPTSGEPIRGLIQDHIVAGVLLTLKDSFFDKETYQSLVFGSIFHRVNDHKIKTLPPCIIKPIPLWSGKQVVSTILKDIAGDRAGVNLDCSAKLKNCWGEHKEEETVIIRDNEVMTGVFDKNQIGASEFGIVHAFDEVYGHEASAELLTCFTRLMSLFLQYHGFTCGVDDLLVTEECNDIRRKIMTAADSDARHATAEFAKQKRKSDSKAYDQDAITRNMRSLLIDDRNRRKLDAEVKKALNKHTSKLISESIPHRLMKPFPKNCMTLMTQSGAKGSLVNASQISCCLGLQEFEGRRVRPTISGKTLPSFEVYDTSAMSGGYVASRFLTGIKPQEYFFHCMAGRDGLIDTAVKTARSGYLQRCLVKALEDLSVKYDGTVRNEADTVVQFKYGGDAIDPLKSSFLHNSKFAAMNHEVISHKYRLNTSNKYADHTDSQVLKYKSSDPVISTLDPWRYKGSISDKFSTKVNDYLTNNPDSLIYDESKKNNKNILSMINVPLNKFKSISNERYMRSLVHPGEAVGVIAAQSIGEPSTQMTLNTFHFAGLDVAHVTVGIPRLIELFMVGHTRTILTTLPVLPQHKVEADVRKFAASISSVTFADALEYIDVVEKISYDQEDKTRERTLSLNVKFDLDEVTKYYGIAAEHFWNTVEFVLVRNIIMTMQQYVQHGKFKGRVATGGWVKQKMLDINQELKDANVNDFDFKDSGEIEEVHSGDVNQFESMNDEDGDNSKSNSFKRNQQNINNMKKKKKRSEDDDDEDEQVQDSEDEMEEDSADQEEQEQENEQEEEEEKKEILSYEKVASLLTQMSTQKQKGILTLDFSGRIKDTRAFLKDAVRRVCQDTRIRTYEGIDKVNVIQKKQGVFELQMEGFNMEELLSIRSARDVIDFNSLITNDITATAHTYGIEAAYQLLVNEIKNVFGLYGIPVDERHISLIAEHMTNSGEYRACNRNSMVGSPGVFHKVSFESAVNFLGSSTAYAESDKLTGPSAQIIFGQTVNQGTGCFDIMVPIKN